MLSIYVDDKGISGKKAIKRIARLSAFFGAKMLGEMTGELCREYVKKRGNKGRARRDLEDLRAAINHHGREGLHHAVIGVVLPEAGLPRERWLSRDEAAKLLLTCWRTREKQRRHRGDSKGKSLPTNKYLLRHLARFILLGLYSGSRATPIASASFYKGGRAFIDLKNGVFYRRPTGAKITKKRQPAIRLPRRLFAYIERWRCKGIPVQYVVEFNGKPVKSVKTAFKSAVAKAGLSGQVTPHTLRHTAATWLMQSGADNGTQPDISE